LAGYPPEVPDIAAGVAGVGQAASQVGDPRPGDRDPSRHIAGQQDEMTGQRGRPPAGTPPAGTSPAGPCPAGASPAGPCGEPASSGALPSCTAVAGALPAGWADKPRPARPRHSPRPRL